MMTRTRLVAATAALLAATAGITLGTAGPAGAAPADRLTLHGYGSMATVTLHVFTLDGHDHTWGEIRWQDFFSGCVWEDQTTDPTQRTWDGQVRETCVNGQFNAVTAGADSTPLYDGPGFWVRACGQDMAGNVVCTPWN
ncbi:hypothetical protein [Streptacidiphilus melanogenes]|uniref:hypothetical protein n=1 Tax=Streptacidiphilus melanogenes TaxID=411235 RepID=UPI0005A5D5BC|nr:hypothetical protein [Streptacidiphilus melanogenes]